ncbi:hypothetical protein OESDEN_08828 [Oesophagostomum dentatum]|uniref:Uncharacterized protein n=1 Tax=Oesophagostomum dentatum TaxID=61180 RepID=A0A0B1T684_OESDE|nr:hypothetical protein OESDEN_08828 [Oesophagostomum dentatum]
MEWTSRCDLSIRYSRIQCKEKGGVWIPGFDISGHCFLMIYSMLVMAEEANAFREWNQVVHRDDDSGLMMREKQERRTKLAQYFVVAMLVLNIVWIKQLTISILYYHIMLDKIVGALVAVFWWYLTYHILYPAGFLSPPIHRIVGALVAVFWWYLTYHILYPAGFLSPPIHRVRSPVSVRR